MPRTKEKARLHSTSISNPRIPVGKWEVETREINTMEEALRGESWHPRLSANCHTQAMACIYLYSHIQIHMREGGREGGRKGVGQDRH